MPSISARQAVNSSSFTPPPLDESLTIPEVYDFHLSTNPSHPLFRYDSDTGGVYELTWKQVVTAIHKVAAIVSSEISVPYQDKRPVIAILAVTDQLSYFTVTAGIMRAGYCAFPISPRNSDVGVANLLQATGASFIFVSQDQAMKKLAKSGIDIVADEPTRAINILTIPSFAELYKNLEDLPDDLPLLQRSDVDEVVLILHSSGSTSFPKPIYLSHRNLLQWGSQPYYGEVDLCGCVLSNHSLPFFHAMGVVSLCWATMTGLILSNFAPKSVPQIATPDSIFKSATTTGSNLIFCVPTFLEEWAQCPEKVAELRKFDAVMFGGAPIHKAVGDTLSKEGLKLYPFYGATELGGTSQFLLKNPPSQGWEYFKISPHTKSEFLPEGPHEFARRLVFHHCNSHRVAKSNSGISNIETYDTNDLMIRHPSNRELWKIYGRADDQIMHSTGEKTNPVPMETIINRHPGVAGSLIFGRGRFQAGVLIEPAGEALDLSDSDHIEQFIDDIWISIEEANDFAPSHSRIFRELVLIADPAKPFLYTAKATPKRQLVLDLYEQDINRLYARIDKANQGEDVLRIESFCADGCLAFVRMTVQKVMKRSSQLRDEDDFFQHGCDSLQAVWIKNHLSSAISQCLPSTAKAIPTNLVYTYPTIQRLSDFMVKAMSNDSPDDFDERSATIAEMYAMVNKYSCDFPQHTGSTATTVPTNETILLTGSTGGLGSYLLESLLLNDTISRVYALNRPNKAKTSLQRQADAFRDRGIDTGLLAASKLVFLEGDASLDNLGLGNGVHLGLRNTVTCIMHIAWHVDFNVRLSSMEPMIAGTRRLINFALSCKSHKPPRFIFASSIGVVRNWVNGIVPEAAILDAATAVGSGYPESKWVAERILTHARETSSGSFSPVIVRIGQLSGGRNGSWNPVEWVPSIVRSGEFLRSLPRTSGYISWIPIYTAAAALVEMRHSRHTFLHLVHPSPVKWNDIAEVMSGILELPLVSYEEWLATLERCQVQPDSAKNNPALLMLEFYQSANQPLRAPDDEAFGFPRLSTTLAYHISRALQFPCLQPMGRNDVEAWISYWRSQRFLSPTQELSDASALACDLLLGVQSSITKG